MTSPSPSPNGNGTSTQPNLFRYLTPEVSMALGAWMLVLAGVMSILAPTEMMITAVFRLTLVAMGFAFYGHGRAVRQRQALLKAGASETTQMRRLGGWLVLLGAVLGVTLVNAVFETIADAPRFFRGQYWSELALPSSPTHDPNLARLHLLEWAGNLFVVGFFPELLALFFQRRRTFRPAVIGTFALLLVLAGWKLWQVNQPPVLPAETQVTQFWWFILALLKAGVWIPYLLFSRRAKLAFDQ